jgi:hypothetical protein
MRRAPLHSHSFKSDLQNHIESCAGGVPAIGAPPGAVRITGDALRTPVTACPLP